MTQGEGTRDEGATSEGGSPADQASAPSLRVFALIKAFGRNVLALAIPLLVSVALLLPVALATGYAAGHVAAAWRGDLAEAARIGEPMLVQRILLSAFMLSVLSFFAFLIEGALGWRLGVAPSASRGERGFGRALARAWAKRKLAFCLAVVLSLGGPLPNVLSLSVYVVIHGIWVAAMTFATLYDQGVRESISASIKASLGQRWQIMGATLLLHIALALALLLPASMLIPELHDSTLDTPSMGRSVALCTLVSTWFVLRSVLSATVANELRSISPSPHGSAF